MRFLKLFAAVCLLAALAVAQQTTFVGLYVPAHGTYRDNWEVPLNFNSWRIDAIFSGAFTVPAMNVTNLTVGSCTGCSSFDLNIPHVYGFGAKQTFSGSATTAAINMRSSGGANPTTVVNGDVYYDYSRYTGLAGLGFYDGGNRQSFAFVSDFQRPPTIGSLQATSAFFTSVDSQNGGLTGPFLINMDPVGAPGTYARGGLLVGSGGASVFTMLDLQFDNPGVQNTLHAILNPNGSATSSYFQSTCPNSSGGFCGYLWRETGTGAYTEFIHTQGTGGVGLNYWDGTNLNQILTTGGGPSNADTWLGATKPGGNVWLNTGNTALYGSHLYCGNGGSYAFGHVCDIDGSGNAQFNGDVSAPHYKTTLSTPASSSAACTPGQMWADGSYIYVCTGSNTIKRAPLATF